MHLWSFSSAEWMKQTPDIINFNTMGQKCIGMLVYSAIYHQLVENLSEYRKEIDGQVYVMCKKGKEAIQVDHIQPIRMDNRLENLTLVTSSQNNQKVY